jgi:hypothetical protein
MSRLGNWKNNWISLKLKLLETIEAKPSLTRKRRGKQSVTRRRCKASGSSNGAIRRVELLVSGGCSNEVNCERLF